MHTFQSKVRNTSYSKKLKRNQLAYKGQDDNLTKIQLETPTFGPE